MIMKTLAFAGAMLALPFLALGAQTRGGLTKTQLLALQQQMRDEGCGNRHAAGIWDAETRQAIRNCARKYNTRADAKALLAAMNIGFSAGDNPPAGGGAAMGGDTGGMKMSSDSAMMMKMMQDPAMKMKHDSMMKMMQDPAMKMKRDSMMMKMMQDPAMKMMHDSMMKMMMKRDSTMKR